MKTHTVCASLYLCAPSVNVLISLHLSFLVDCSLPRQDASESVAIVQRFPFSSALQRMSVVAVERHGRSAFAFIKGSPEMVASLCRAETGPFHFQFQRLLRCIHFFFCTDWLKWACQDSSWIALPVVFTVPSQFAAKLSSFSREGLRVLALAYKPLDASADFKTMERWEQPQCCTSIIHTIILYICEEAK